MLLHAPVLHVLRYGYWDGRQETAMYVSKTAATCSGDLSNAPEPRAIALPTM